MKFTARKTYTFYPAVNGNLDLPENEQLSVEIIRPTAEERGDVSYVDIKAGADKSSPLIRYGFDAKNILNRCVGEIKNLEVEDFENPGKTRTIKSGKELAKESFYGMNALVDAVCAEVCADVISDAQKKISESPSVLSGTDGTGGN